ncbi:hypothetical protein CQW23_22724 [Capsicum baccatum]|uniref:Amine oxidase domain-containing protein n=1 Tax=Capsicum baccatum TaxID=33114 RepID=A0A2G2W1P6_CAPBA|nr:hypothetical protein CQW23_22724 [Capsicum baccatum]
MKVAVVGAGISGLVSAYELAKAGVEVVVYEKENYLGGHPNTVTVDGVDLDLGFMVFNRKNVLNPYFWQMIREIIRFKQDVTSYLEALDNNPDIDRNETVGQFIQSHGYSELFQKAYLVMFMFFIVIDFDTCIGLYFPFNKFSLLGNIDTMMMPSESRGNIDTMMMPGESGGNIDTMMMPGESGGNIDTMMMSG